MTLRISARSVMVSEPKAFNRVQCVLLGAGGHAKVLIDSLSERTDIEIIAALDPDPAKKGQDLFGVPIAGGDHLLSELADQGVTCFVVGLGSTRDNRPRRRLFDMARAANLMPLSVIHPSAVVSRYCELGSGCQILPGAIVNPAGQIGCNTIVNSGAIVEHDCRVGDHVHIATGARLASTVRVGNLAFIGAGATVRQCITIGEGAVVGAGAVVVRDVRPWTVVVGVPAREMGESHA